jgi:hypothetical protein
VNFLNRMNHRGGRRPRPVRTYCAWALRLIGCALAIASLSTPAAGKADPLERPSVTAPPNSVVLEHTRGGAYFVAEPLKEEYDRLLGRVRALRAELDAGQVSGPEVLRELKELQPKLDRLRADIEKAKVLVSPLKVHQQAEEVTFDLGPERLLVVNGDHVRLIGWDGPGVKCVIEKTVLAPDQKPVDEHLRGLKVVHKHGPAPNVVGRTAAERDAEERDFLATPDGAKLTGPQRESRAAFLREIDETYAPYAAFQGKPVDMVSVEGLTHEQGNRQVSVKIESDGGGASHGSDWQRHAVLTVYVPPCHAVAVRGCLGSLDVRGVRAAVLLTRDDSHDRDYRGTFHVRDLHGPLTAIDVPLDEVAGVDGAVTVDSTTELANTGTTHGPDGRTMYIPPPRALSLRNIKGDLTARFTRADLTVEGVAGRIDVRNDFGSTALIATATLPADKAHRLISASGRVEVKLSAGVLEHLPLYALTNCGSIRTDVPQDVLEETNFTLGRAAAETGRYWRGLKPVRKERDDLFGVAGRVKAIVEGADRSPGLDVISRAGAIRVQLQP